MTHNVPKTFNQKSEPITSNIFLKFRRMEAIWRDYP